MESENQKQERKNRRRYEQEIGYALRGVYRESKIFKNPRKSFLLFFRLSQIDFVAGDPVIAVFARGQAATVPSCQHPPCIRPLCQHLIHGPPPPLPRPPLRPPPQAPSTHLSAIQSRSRQNNPCVCRGYTRHCSCWENPAIRPALLLTKRATPPASSSVLSIPCTLHNAEPSRCSSRQLWRCPGG